MPSLYAYNYQIYSNLPESQKYIFKRFFLSINFGDVKKIENSKYLNKKKGTKHKNSEKKNIIEQEK